MVANNSHRLLELSLRVLISITLFLSKPVPPGCNYRLWNVATGLVTRNKEERYNQVHFGGRGVN